MKQHPNDIAKANSLLGYNFAKTLEKIGIKNIFFSPGSRSTPLILGIERHSNIELTPVLDERTAAFIALGKSKRDQFPTGLICTSGSALTHWFPAVTEACHSSIPIFLFSADRPLELQDCAAGQTIDQQNIFGKFVREFHQMETPSLERSFTAYLGNTLQLAFRQSIGLNPGPVHLNFPLREPFLPASFEEPDIVSDEKDIQNFRPSYPNSCKSITEIVSSCKRPLIIAGQFTTKKSLQIWLDNKNIPVLCDSLSPGRHTGHSSVILRYENLLRDFSFTQKARPDLIIVLGPLPTSKTLRKWIDDSDAKRIIIEPRGVNVDPLSSESTSFQIEYGQLANISFPVFEFGWANLWIDADQKIEKKLATFFSATFDIFEGKLAYLLSLHLPKKSQIFIANSMPMRDFEWFWLNISSDRILLGNRGVNGIDGTLGTAIGMAHKSNKPNFLVTGDLAFLHDSNALLFAKQFQGNLTVFVINNGGGGIFEHLPIAKEPEFEKCFATPQSVDLEKLCSTFKVKHELLSSWTEIIERIKKPAESGIHVIEILTNRKKDRQIRQKLLSMSPFNA